MQLTHSDRVEKYVQVSAWHTAVTRKQRRCEQRQFSSSRRRSPASATVSNDDWLIPTQPGGSVEPQLFRVDPLNPSLIEVDPRLNRLTNI